jgi:hypothetical protein
MARSMPKVETEVKPQAKPRVAVRRIASTLHDAVASVRFQRRHVDLSRYRERQRYR